MICLLSFIHQAMIDDALVESSVETGIDRFTSAWNKSGASRGVVFVGFHEKSVKKGFFGSKEEKIFWERWVIPLVLTSEKDRPRTSSDRERVALARHAALTSNLLYVVECVNAKKDHLPPMKHAPAVPLAYSFEISHTTGEKADESWGISNTFKRLLEKGPPLLLS